MTSTFPCRSRFFAGAALIASAFLVPSCQSSSGGPSGSGGAGGSLGSGGMASSGGVTGRGETGQGGTPVTGGAIGTGGAATSTGGVATSTGGVATSTGGVATSTGGVATSTGGASGGTGGATGTAGSTGGREGASGGSTGNGGTTAAGGATAMGGATVSTGGLPWLKVVGNQIQVEATGQQVILRGVSIEGLGQQSTDSQHNINGVIDLITNRNDTGGTSPGWYPVMLRLPVDSGNGANAEINTLLKPAVDYATKKGLYAIIDLHYVDNPYNNVQAVNSFWTTVAPMFKDYPNVIYEPFNESSVQDSWATYKPTMQAWVNLIRGFAPKNLIFAGSPAWDQTMGDAATNPLTGGNIVYTVHMYYHHWTSAWNKAQVEACAKVNPVVMTEWGYNNAASETEPDPDISVTYGKPMLEWLEAMGGSWTDWCASNSWLPRMFSDNWSLLVGPREEGGFVKDWLYTNRNVKSPIAF